MKKMLSLICMTLLAMSSYCFSACNSNSSEMDENKFEVSSLNIVTKKCVVQQKENYSNSVESFYDDDYNYWVFDMGVLIDVPLEDTYSYYKYTGGNIEHEFSTTKTTASSIKTKTEKTASQSKTWSNSHSVNAGLSLNFGISETIGLKISAGYNYEHSESATQSNSWSRSFENCQSYSESEENTIKISFDEGCEKGYYRYLFVGVVNVYTAVIQNKKSGEIFVDTYTKVIAYGYSLDFDKSSPLFNNYDDKTLSFDLNLINNLPQPTRKLNNTSVEVGLEPVTVFNGTIRTETKKINGSGHYSLDTFTLEKSIRELINLGYIKLNIKISYELKEVDNCIQYVSLYTSTNYYIRNETIEHGGSKKDTSWGTHYMECEVLLEELDSNILNFKCKAQNAIFKDFYIRKVIVNIVAEG